MTPILVVLACRYIAIELDVKVCTWLKVSQTVRCSAVQCSALAATADTLLYAHRIVHALSFSLSLSLSLSRALGSYRMCANIDVGGCVVRLGIFHVQYAHKIAKDSYG